MANERGLWSFTPNVNPMEDKWRYECRLLDLSTNVEIMTRQKV